MSPWWLRPPGDEPEPRPTQPSAPANEPEPRERPEPPLIADLLSPAPEYASAAATATENQEEVSPGADPPTVA